MSNTPSTDELRELFTQLIEPPAAHLELLIYEAEKLIAEREQEAYKRGFVDGGLSK